MAFLKVWSHWFFKCQTHRMFIYETNTLLVYFFKACTCRLSIGVKTVWITYISATQKWWDSHTQKAFQTPVIKKEQSNPLKHSLFPPFLIQSARTCSDLCNDGGGQTSFKQKANHPLSGLIQNWVWFIQWIKTHTHTRKKTTPSHQLNL